MRTRLRKIREFFTPRTAVGFVFCGWVGAVASLWLSPIFSGILGMIPAITIYVPLLILAQRARDKQIETAKFVQEVREIQAEAIEDDDRTNHDDEE